MNRDARLHWSFYIEVLNKALDVLEEGSTSIPASSQEHSYLKAESKLAVNESRDAINALESIFNTTELAPQRETKAA